MNDNIVYFPGQEDSPRAVLSRALEEADKMDGVILYAFYENDPPDLTNSGLRLSDLVWSAVDLNARAQLAVLQVSEEDT